MLKGIQYFDAAITKDPKYALAYAGLSDSYLALAIDWQSPKEVVPKALEYAHKALGLDESLGEGALFAGRSRLLL